MTPAALAAIEARVAAATPDAQRVTEAPGRFLLQAELGCINGLAAWFTLATVPKPDEAETGYTEGTLDESSAKARAELYLNAPTDLAALLAHIRQLEAEREAEIAAAVAAERERCAGIADDMAAAHVDRRDGCLENPPAALVCARQSQTAADIAAAIREPKP